MAIPAINEVQPNIGHTGGRTLVAISGANFALPSDPPADKKSSGPIPTVRVFFGAEEATNVGVVSPTLLYCLSPIHDPGSVAISIENLEPSPASIVTRSAPFSLSDGMTIELAVGNGQKQTITFRTSGFASLSAASAQELAAAVNAQIRAAKARVRGDKVQIATDAVGANASLRIFSGTALDALGIDVGTVTGSDEVAPVPGERVTITEAFTYVRPDLSEESHLTTVIRYFIEEMKRQIIENVSWPVHTDYDDETGDGLNLAYVGKLPAIVISGCEFPESLTHVYQHPDEVMVASDAFLERSPPSVHDAVLTLVGITDTAPELFNMVQVIRRFFRKNSRLIVPRDIANPSAGSVRYDLEFTPGQAISVATQGDGSNVQSFSFTAAIRGILLEDMPGLPRVGVPEAISGVPQESTIHAGKTASAVSVGRPVKL